MGTPQPPPRPGGGRKTVVIAVVAATAVVIAAGVTGYLVLGGDGGTDAAPGPSASASREAAATDNPRAAGGGDKAVVPGWKAVVNPDRGIAFDVPAEWQLKSADWASYVTEKDDPEDKPLVGFKAPAVLKERWCQADGEGGGTEDTPIAAAGSRGESGSSSTEEAARENARLWIHGGYAQSDKQRVRAGSVEPYTTASGITGSLATAHSTGARNSVEKDGKKVCDFDGKAFAFAFKDAKGDLASWTFHGVKGVPEEVPETMVRKILSTVRQTGGPARP
ncbi:hypothetical protein GCM10018779_46540 [Streptomyces griseocarneus]|nr:hypothetical protein GCM10018779_46540 [Streptomyces griseocarneus]